MKTRNALSARAQTFAGLFVLATLAGSLFAEPIDLIAWNLESGESSMQWVAGKIRDRDGVELWGLSEVPSSAQAAI